jgi:hypothetical protein
MNVLGGREGAREGGREGEGVTILIATWVIRITRIF